MNILRTYASSYGTWYVQAQTDREIVEMAFDHEPDAAEIQLAIIAAQPVVSDIELAGENG